MAANHIGANKQHDVIRQAIRGAQLIREAEAHLAAALAGMVAMKDGDGTQAAHFDLLATECAIEVNDYATANDAAKALFDEVNSVVGNSATAISAAKQLCAYLGV